MMSEQKANAIELRPRSRREYHNVLDLRDLARRRLPSPICHYLDGGERYKDIDEYHGAEG
jgi:hypothetical protein